MAKGLVNKKRVRPMGTGDHGAGPVVYWCSRDQRVEDNWALIHACDTAKQAGVPCVVVFSLVTEFLGAGARQFGFMLRGLREMEAELKKKGIPFVLIKGNPGVTVPKFANDTAAHSVVMDQSPLRLGREWRETIAEKATCPSSEVDAHNVVPVWEASPKMEVGARTLRGKLLKLYPEFLVEYPEVPDVSGAMKLFASEALTSAIQKNSHDWDKTIALAVDAGKSVPEVTWAVPGETAALIVLDNFLTRRLKLYESRNDPAKPQCLSGLSPYLHFGQISGARCAMEAKKFSKSAPKAVEVFFEELVVRRELADNFCWYSPKYDTLDGQKYDWAKDTLQLHAKDKRPYLYSKEEFETAKTHDKLWNAAQKELVYGGKMHGFMRMYWAKKILEWTASPEQALEFAIFLNDKYSLDGRDPSGYVGCAWSIVGVHDQGWKEREGTSFYPLKSCSPCTAYVVYHLVRVSTRPVRNSSSSPYTALSLNCPYKTLTCISKSSVFGKIRYMAYSGCEKKFKIPDYIARVNELVSAVKEGKTDCSEINPGRFHIDFGKRLSERKGGAGDVAEKNKKRIVDSEEFARMVKAATAAGAGDADRAVDVLTALKAVAVTAELLAFTGAGKAIKQLSKQNENVVVAAAAKSVVDGWKKALV
tara:strand:+ start:71867 stop:73804 length:1938 start_codon:yes stop_codon:yes gene_type:complete